MTTEFTHFNLVIRLSNAKQLAFRFYFVFGEIPLLLRSLVIPWNVHFHLSTTAPNNQKLLFPAAASAFDVIHDMSDRRQQACPLPAGVVPLVFGEVKHFVHLIRWNSYSRLIPSGTTGPRSRRGVTRDL